MRTILTIAAIGVALMGSVSPAGAFGMRRGPEFFSAAGGPGGPHGPGGPAGMPLRLLIHQMTPDQRRQVREMLIADRGTRRDTLQQLRDAHEALADKMFVAGKLTDADVAPLVAKIGELHQQLLQHGTKVMLQVRAVATPDQLAKAAATKAKIDQLHDEMRALLGTPDGPDEAGDDLPE